MAGLEHLRDMLGDEKHSLISDADIKETLYHYYFDIEKSTAYLLGLYTVPLRSRPYTNVSHRGAGA